MPDLSKSKVESPIKDMRQTEQHTRGSFYGSADTALGRLVGGNYYDEGLTTYDRQQDSRYYSQGPLNASGNFLADLGVQTLSGIPSIIGGVTGIAKGIGSATLGGKFTDGFDDNPFMNLTKTMSAWGDENFPQMYQSDFQDKTFGQKLFSAPGQLLTSNVSTIGFLAQSFGLAGLLAKANVGARVIQAVAKGKNFSAALTELAAPDLAKIASTLDEVTLNSFLTTNEAAMEGQDAHDQIVQQLRTERLAGKNEMSDEEINNTALNSLGNVFWENMLTLGVTNGFFTKLVAPLRTPKAVATRANRLALKTLAGTESFAEASAKNMSKFERFLFDQGDAAGMTVKSILEQGLSEGLLEENIQYSIQKVNDVNHRNRSLGDSLLDVAKNMVREGLDFSDDKRFESIALGAIVGAGSTGIASLVGAGPAAEAREYKDTQERLTNALNKQYTDFFSASVAKKSDDKKGKLITKEENGQTKFFNEEEDKLEEISADTYFQMKESLVPDEKTGEYTVKGKYETDAQGNVLKDPVKAAKFAAQQQIQSEYDDLIDAELSKPNVDDLKIKLYQLSKLFNLANTAFEAGAADMLIRKLEAYKSLSAEEQQAQGIDPKEAEQTIDNWVDHVKRLEKNYLSVQNALIPPVVSKQDKDILGKMKDYTSDIGGRIVTLDRLLLESDKQLSDKITNSEDSAAAQTVVDQLLTDTNLDLKSETDKPEANTEIARLVSNKQEITQAREQLGEIYNKLLDPKKGFANFKKASLSKDMRNYQTIKDTSSNLVLNGATTNQDLDKYEERRLQKERHEARIAYGKTVFFSDAINKFIKFMTMEGVTPETADSLRSLVDKILSQELTIYPDQANKLKGLIDTFNQEVINTKQNVENKLGSEFDMSLDDAEMFGYENPDVAALLDEYDRATELEVALGELASKPEVVKEKIDSLTGYPQLDVSESTLRKKALDVLTVSAKGAVEAAQEQKEDYDDLEKVEYDLLQLEHLKRLYENSKDSVHKSELKIVNRLIKQLKEIAEQIKKIRQDRDLKNKKQDLYYAEGHLRVFDKVSEEALIKAGVTAEQLGKLKALRIVDPVLASKVSLFFLSKLPSEELQTLAAGIENEARDLIGGLEAFKIPTSIGTVITPEELEAALTKPTKAFAVVFEKLLIKEKNIGSGDVKVLEDFQKNYDVIEFEKNVDKFKGETSSVALKQLLLMQSELLALAQLNSIEGATFNEVDFLEKSAKELTGKTIPPSSSQFRVVRELVMFTKSKHDESGELFTAGAALKAPAGAGKSLVVASLLKAAAGLSDKEIMTAAPLAKAAENIATSVSTANGVNTVTEITDLLSRGAIPKGVKIILVDEAGALNLREAYDFAIAIAKYNRENPSEKVKFMMLYDPNQVTPGNVSKAALDLASFHEVSLVNADYFSNADTKDSYKTGQKLVQDLVGMPALPFIHNITQISPLSTVYRSDVSEIVDLQNRFKSAEEVKNVKTAASSNPNTSTKDILGSFIELGNTIKEAFARSVVDNAARSKTIIVGSIEKQAHYKALFPEAEVLTVAEAQGITRDEVYIDLQKQDLPESAGVSVFNQYMYTAMSRASKYLHVSNIEGEFSVDTAIPNRVETLKKSKVQNTDSLVKQLQVDADTIKDITKQIATAPAAKAEEIIEEAIHTEEETGETLTADNPGPPTLTQETGYTGIGEHILSFPSSNVFEEGELIPAIKGGERLLVVKDITQKVSGQNKQRFILLQELKSEGSIYGYRIAAVLGDDELDKFSSIVSKEALDALEPYVFKDFSATGKGVVYPDSNNEITSFEPVFVSPKSHDLIYVYGNEATYTFANDVDQDGKLERLAILDRHLNSMYGGEASKYIANYDDVLNNFENYTQIIAFKTDKEVRAAFKNAKSDKERPRLNVPYLIIRNIELVNGGKLAPQFIRLIPSVLNVNTAPSLGVNTDAILSFIDKVGQLEAWIPKLNLGGKYGELRNGGEIKIDQNNVYYPFHYFVTQLSKAYQALSKGEDLEIRMTKYDNLLDAFPGISAKTLPLDFLKLGYELDVLVHGEVEDGEKRSYKGEAQVAIDSIGTQNLVLTLPQGKNLILKDYRVTFFNEEENREVTESSGISLLGPLKFTRTKGMAFNAYMKSKLVLDLNAYHKNLVARGKGDSARAKFLQETLKDPYTKHLNPITTADLVDLFKRGQDSNGNLSNGISEGFGIRHPMLSGQFRANFYVNSTIKDLYLGNQLETNFEKVIPTQLVVSREQVVPDGSPLEDVQQTAPPREPNPIDRLRRAIREGKSVQTVDEELKREFAEFMETDTFEEAVTAYKAHMSEAAGWNNSVRNIYQALGSLKNDINTDSVGTKEEIVQDIRNSVGVTGVGKGAGNTASRDFIRGTVMLRIFPSSNRDFLAEISDFART